MESFERHIEIDCVGENTKKHYKGAFTVKLFLTNKEKLKLTNKLTKHVGDIATIASSWNLQGYIDVIKSLEDSEENEIRINDRAKEVIIAYVLNFLPSVPPSANIISNTVMIQEYIIDSPEWWVELNNGMDLLDQKPLDTLLEEFSKVRELFLEDDTPAD